MILTRACTRRLCVQASDSHYAAKLSSFHTASQDNKCVATFRPFSFHVMQ